MKRQGFTLAETLITLGIIGIVAAMTIPNLITEHKKRTTVTKLERAISVLNQAYKLSYDDLGEPESAFDLGPEEYFKTYWAPYIKVLTYCSSYQICDYKNKQPFKTISNQNSGFTLVSSLGRTTFLTSDGFLYSILTSARDFKTPQYYVVVDLNGSAEPNTFGKDVFVLKRVPEKGIMPNGYDLSNEEVNQGCSINTENLLYSQYCAEKIRRAGWKMEKDYPWK